MEYPLWRRAAVLGRGRPLLPATRPSSGSRLPGIEGLRAIAAGSVLVYHCWRYGSSDYASPDLGWLTGIMPHLALGVVLFFALSGFLLYRPFAAAIIRNVAAPRVQQYLRNRALRILPAYWVILLCSGLVLQAGLLRDGNSALRLGSLAEQPATVAKNILLVQSYGPSTLLTGIGPAWSLVIEVAYYLTLPFLATGAVMLSRRTATRQGRRWAALVPPAAMLATGLVGKLALHLLGRSSESFGWGADWYSVLARSFLTNADLFAFGMVLGVVHTEVVDGSLKLPRRWREGCLLVAVGVALVAVRLLPPGAELGVAKYDLTMAVSCGLLLAIVVLPDPGPSRWRWLLSLLDARPLIAIGVASYSLFLWHEPLTYWLRDHGFTMRGAGGFLVNLVVIAAVSGTLAFLTYRIVELPAMSRTRRQVRPDWPSPGVAGAGQPPGHRREQLDERVSQACSQPPVEQPQDPTRDPHCERRRGGDGHDPRREPIDARRGERARGGGHADRE
jgi:peptidoglycan/LPS O-acetylase OafA/YrhL